MVSHRRRVVGATLKRALDVAWYIGVVGASLFTVALLIVVARGGHPRLALPVDLTVPGPYAVDGSHVGVIANASGQLSVTPPAGVVLAGLAFAVAGAGFVLMVPYHLRVLVAQAVAGSPFGPGSAWRVRLIGGSVIAGELVRGGVVVAGSRWAAHHVRGPAGFRSGFPVRTEIVVLGVLIMLLGEVFRIGSALQQDHDLTI